MELLIIVIVGALFAWLCSEMAKTRNRNTTVWAVLGFLFGLLAVLVLALIGKSND